MMHGHFDSSSLWHCNFNPYSENYNDIYPKLLEQYDIERSTYENFVGEVNNLIRMLKRRLRPNPLIKYITIVHIILSILTLGMWLIVFGIWYIINLLLTKRKAVKETERIKYEIERLITNANSIIFHPKGIDVITIFDIEKEKRTGVESFLESYILIQTCKSQPSSTLETGSDIQTVRANPSAVDDHHHDEENGDYYYYK